MPLYEYVCRTCHSKFDEVLTIKEHETKKVHCPKCQGTDLEKVFESFFAKTASKTVRFVYGANRASVFAQALAHRLLGRGPQDQRIGSENCWSLKTEPDRSLLASVRDDRFKQLRICVWM